MTDFETHPVGTGKRIEELEANVADLRESLVTLHDLGYRNGQQAAKAKLAKADVLAHEVERRMVDLGGYDNRFTLRKALEAYRATLKGQDDE